ncbi:MAG: hypothetical protein IKO01_06095 [Kiritimatiellae bacterium]|nr:hypothetical protein [Kiritimatiellia bacterium]
MSNEIRKIALNPQRARYMVAHWDDDPMSDDDSIPVQFDVSNIRIKIGELAKERPDFREGLAQLHQAVATKEFWEQLAENMEGTQFSACGLSFKKFTYFSALKPLWALGEDVAGEEERGGDKGRAKRKRKGAGCLGFLFRGLLVAWLVWYAFKLWGPRPGDLSAPATEQQTLDNNLETQTGDKP